MFISSITLTTASSDYLIPISCQHFSADTIRNGSTLYNTRADTVQTAFVRLATWTIQRPIKLYQVTAYACLGSQAIARCRNPTMSCTKTSSNGWINSVLTRCSSPGIRMHLFRYLKIQARTTWNSERRRTAYRPMSTDRRTKLKVAMECTLYLIQTCNSLNWLVLSEANSLTIGLS